MVVEGGGSLHFTINAPLERARMSCRGVGRPASPPCPAYMRLISRPKSIRQRVREGLIKWAKVRAEEVKQQKRVDELRESRGEVPSASTRHGSTTFKPAPKTSKRKEAIRENEGQTQTRTKIGKKVAVINERMGAISKRIAKREKRGDG